jgi:hypothetical protein
MPVLVVRAESTSRVLAAHSSSYCFGLSLCDRKIKQPRIMARPYVLERGLSTPTRNPLVARLTPLRPAATLPAMLRICDAILASISTDARGQDAAQWHLGGRAEAASGSLGDEVELARYAGDVATAADTRIHEGERDPLE